MINSSSKSRTRKAPPAIRPLLRGSASTPGTQTFRLGYRPPLEWRALVGFLGARAASSVERVEQDVYVRTVAIGPASGWLRVAPHATRPVLHVVVAESLGPVAAAIAERLRSLFDLGAEPARIRRVLGADPRLAPMVRRAPGLRIAGAFDGFELLLRAILGQQVSVRAATTIAERFAQRFGEPIQTPVDGLTRLTPSAERIGASSVPALRALGLTQRRAETVQCAARAYAGGTLALYPGADVVRAREALLALPGIGPWTVEYVTMRAMSWPDAFPHTDLVLMRLLGTRRRLELEALSERWRPWRSYAAFHLWHSLT